MSIINIIFIIEVFITSLMILRILYPNRSLKDMFVGIFALSFILIFVSAYILDLILNTKLSIINISIAILPLFIISVLFRSYRIDLEYFKNEKKYLMIQILVLLICFIIGIFPSLPSFYPTGIGDTQHHYAAASFIFENLRLPRLHELYPEIHHGLMKYCVPQTPLGFHILIHTFSKALQIPLISFLQPFVVFLAALTSTTISKTAIEIDPDKSVFLSIIAGILSFTGGLLSMAILGGTLYMVLGYFFVTVSILFLFEFDKRPSITNAIFPLILNVGIILTYSILILLSFPLFILITIRAWRILGRLRVLILISLVILTSIISFLPIGFIYERLTGGTTISWPGIYGGIISGTLQALVSNKFIIVLLVSIILLILAYILYRFPKFKKLENGFENEIFLIATVVAVYPFIDLLIRSTALWIPGYDYFSMFGVTLLLSIGYFFSTIKTQNKTLLIALSLNYLIAVAYFFIWDPLGVHRYGFYYYSKHAILASILVPVLSPIIFRSLIFDSKKLFKNIKGIIGPKSHIWNNFIAGANLSRTLNHKFIRLFLLTIIILGIGYQFYQVHEHCLKAELSITPEEYSALEWMRYNYVEEISTENFEYYIILDNHRARWFVAITHKQFNMRSIKGNWINPPFPLSIELSDFCERAGIGDVLILDEKIDNETPKLFLELNDGGIRNFQYENLHCSLRLIHKEGPLYFIKMSYKYHKQ
ncbi:hypothetical protein [[Eubacterium] cellulosolvens]